jgi:hypothetical protein
MTNRICTPGEFARSMLDQINRATEGMTPSQREAFFVAWARSVQDANGLPPEPRLDDLTTEFAATSLRRAGFEVDYHDAGLWRVKDHGAMTDAELARFATKFGG